MLPGLTSIAGKAGGGASGVFPSAYRSFIDSFSTGNQIWIDASNGNDTTGDGSEGAPYATIYKAIQEHPATAGVAMILMPGTYTDDVDDLTTYLGGTSFSSGYTNFPTLHDYYANGLAVETHWIGAPGQTIIQPDFTGKTRPTMFALKDLNSTARGLILRRDNQGETVNYEVAVNCSFPTSTSANAFRGTIYNCVMEEINANGKMSYNYGSANSASFEHCTFVASDWLTSFSSQTTTYDYCQVGYTGTTPENHGTFTNMQRGSTFDADYQADTNNTTHGVYSGTYAWPAP